MTDTDSQGHYTSGLVDYLSQAGRGTTDAQNALNAAVSAGQSSGAIYFAMDFDPAKSTDPTTNHNRISVRHQFTLPCSFGNSASFARMCVSSLSFRAFFRFSETM